MGCGCVSRGVAQLAAITQCASLWEFFLEKTIETDCVWPLFPPPGEGGKEQGCRAGRASPLRVTLCFAPFPERERERRARQGEQTPISPGPAARQARSEGIKHSNMNTPSREEVQVAFNGLMILKFSSSHYISHFAAVFIVARTKISIA